MRGTDAGEALAGGLMRSQMAVPAEIAWLPGWHAHADLCATPDDHVPSDQMPGNREPGAQVPTGVGTSNAPGSVAGPAAARTATPTFTG